MRLDTVQIRVVPCNSCYCVLPLESYLVYPRIIRKEASQNGRVPGTSSSDSQGHHLFDILSLPEHWEPDRLRSKAAP